MYSLLQAPFRLVHVVWKHRQLTYQLTKREIFYGHSLQILGGAWALIHPFLLTLTYFLVFGFVFRVRLNIKGVDSESYTNFIMAGLISWIPLQQAMAKACTSISSNTSLVKQVVFPVEVLPFTSILYAFFLQAVFIFIFVFLNIIFCACNLPLSSLILVPFAILIQLFMTASICIFLSAICVYLHDVREILQFFLTACLFILPILYVPGAIPRIFEILMYFNPLSYIVWIFQDAFFYGGIHHPLAWGGACMFSVVLFIGASNMFEFLKPWFGEMAQ